MSGYKKALAKYLDADPQDISLFWKGRVGLYALLKAAGIGKGDEVIIPAFTCVVVPNAIIYLEATPIYVDVQEDSMNASLEQIQAAFTDKTKAIICQNTFGLSSHVDELAAFAKSKGVVSLEDCTHGFGGTYKGKANGTYCDGAFYSTQWNKPFSTGVGGFSLINNRSAFPDFEVVMSELEAPSFKSATVLKILIWARKNILVPSTYWFLLKVYRWLSKKNLVVGSSQGEEITSVVMPDNYFVGLSDVQASTGIKALEALPEVLKLRKKVGEKYTAFLEKHDKVFVDRNLHDNHAFLKYPLFVKDRDAFNSKAENAKISLGDWFNSPIHPVQSGFETWLLDVSKFPVATKKAKHIVNLPCDITYAEEVIQFLEKNLDDIV